MEIVVGREYVYGRFNATATVVTVLEGYVPVEIRLQNDRTCWVHRTELRETVPSFDSIEEHSKPQAHAEPYTGDASDFYWRGMPETFVLREDVEWHDDDGQKHGVKKGTTLYIRATHDVFDVFLLSTHKDPEPENLLFRASGQWVMMQVRENHTEERKAREAEILIESATKVLEDEKKTTKQNKRTIIATKVDRVLDWGFNMAPFFFFFVSLFFAWFDDGMQAAIWAVICAVFFGIVKVVDVLYLLHYKMGRMQDADSE